MTSLVIIIFRIAIEKTFESKVVKISVNKA